MDSDSKEWLIPYEAVQSYREDLRKELLALQTEPTLLLRLKAVFRHLTARGAHKQSPTNKQPVISALQFALTNAQESLGAETVRFLYKRLPPHAQTLASLDRLTTHYAKWGEIEYAKKAAAGLITSGTTAREALDRYREHTVDEFGVSILNDDKTVMRKSRTKDRLTACAALHTFVLDWKTIVTHPPFAFAAITAAAENPFAPFESYDRLLLTLTSPLLASAPTISAETASYWVKKRLEDLTQIQPVIENKRSFLEWNIQSEQKTCVDSYLQERAFIPPEVSPSLVETLRVLPLKFLCAPLCAEKSTRAKPHLPSGCTVS